MSESRCRYFFASLASYKRIFSVRLIYPSAQGHGHIDDERDSQEIKQQHEMLNQNNSTATTLSTGSSPCMVQGKVSAGSVCIPPTVCPLHFLSLHHPFACPFSTSSGTECRFAGVAVVFSVELPPKMPAQLRRFMFRDIRSVAATIASRRGTRRCSLWSNYEPKG